MIGASAPMQAWLGGAYLRDSSLEAGSEGHQASLRVISTPPTIRATTA
jgi:hypothetical protein